jgi:hypothetical protein
MATRQELNNLLKTLLGSDYVYYSPPETVKMNYPAIKYDLNNHNTKYASNNLYLDRKRYEIIVIDSNPDSIIPEKVGKLPLCTFNRKYKSNNLNHFVYYIYF